MFSSYAAWSILEEGPNYFQGLNLEKIYTAGGFVWCDRPFYLVNWPQEKWTIDFHDDATPLSFQLQVTEDFF